MRQIRTSIRRAYDPVTLDDAVGERRRDPLAARAFDDVGGFDRALLHVRRGRRPLVAPARAAAAAALRAARAPSCTAPTAIAARVKPLQVFGGVFGQASASARASAASRAWCRASRCSRARDPRAATVSRAAAGASRKTGLRFLGARPHFALTRVHAHGAASSRTFRRLELRDAPRRRLPRVRARARERAARSARSVSILIRTVEPPGAGCARRSPRARTRPIPTSKWS